MGKDASWLRCYASMRNNTMRRLYSYRRRISNVTVSKTIV